MAETDITIDRARPAEDWWAAIHERDSKALGRAVVEGFQSQLAMFPRMASGQLARSIKDSARDSLG